MYVDASVRRNTLTLERNSYKSVFTGFGYGGQMGFSIPIGDVAVTLGADAGRADLTSNFVSNTYWERGSLTWYSGVVGFRYGIITIGGIYQSNDLTITALDTNNGRSQETLKGIAAGGFANLLLSGGPIYTVLFLNYGVGSMTNGGPNQTDMSGGIALRYILPISTGY